MLFSIKAFLETLNWSAKPWGQNEKSILKKEDNKSRRQSGKSVKILNEGVEFEFFDFNSLGFF